MRTDDLESTVDTVLLRINRVYAKRLFGLYTHEVNLKVKDRVTILHGPNGVGKTALLRLVAAIFSGKIIESTKLPFDRLEIDLSDGSQLILEPSNRNSSTDRSILELRVYLAVNKKITQHGNISISVDAVNEWAARFESESPYLSRRGEGRWQDHRLGDEISSLDVYLRYANSARAMPRRTAPFSEPDWFSALRRKVSVHLIETQRLLRMVPVEPRYGSWEGGVVPMVRDYARNLHARITETLALYATRSQLLDQTFPQRLLSTGGPPSLSKEDLRSRMENLELQRAELQKIGLLDASTSNPFDLASLDDLNTSQYNVMSLYADDTHQKLAVLDDLSRRILLLLENVNKKLTHKNIHISKEKGFCSIGRKGEALDLDALSSGEQHEIVLLYDLLFRVRPGTLVLIDEPELSLHVAWQKMFIPDLLEIADTAKFDALIATHSPFIIGDRHDLMLPLAADVDE